MKPSKYFNDLVHDFGLRDMGFNGLDYIWHRGFTQERLDCFLCNSYWDESFPDSAIQHLIRLKLDHMPILLQVGNSVPCSSYAPFCYLFSWSSHIDFNRMVADNWAPSSSLSETIISFTKAVDVWNKTIYGDIGSKKRVVMA
ncbi:hypothetical protein V6N13_041420 [Hibiscus sabdariffa]